MIRLYSGTPGSGKSAHCARDIVLRSQFGEPIIGNIPVDLSRYKRAKYVYIPNHELTPKRLIQFSKEYFGGRSIGPKDEGAILLVLDECQLLFNSREWQHSARAEWLEFFTQHRHWGYDITLIAQFDRMIDRQIRSLIEYEVIHRKLNNFGWRGFLLSLVFGRKTFVAVKMWYPLRERLGAEFIRGRKKYWCIYDSYAHFVADGGGEGSGGSLPTPPATNKE